MNLQTAIYIFIGFAFGYYINRRVHRFLGNIIYICISAGVMLTSDTDTQTIIGLILLLASIISLIYDVIEKARQ